MSEIDQDDLGEVTSGNGRRTRPPRVLPWVLGGVVVLAAIVGYAMWSQVRPLVEAVDADTVSFTVPTAPSLTPASGEQVYRIDPSQSVVAYGVDENIVGQSASRATGTTRGIAGDLAINRTAPDTSRLGEIVVDVSQLESDNSVRDARIRHAFLESSANPLVQFRAGPLTGLPASIVDGETYDITVTGTMTVRGVDVPVTWDAQATVSEDRVTVRASTVVTMSSLGIGPISLAGLVSTSDEVTLDLSVVAVDPALVPPIGTVAAPGTTVASGESPSFRDDVAPILATNCASCHTGDAFGTEHVSLDTAGQAHDLAAGLGTVTQARYMPPWPASTVGVPLDHSRALSQSDIDTIVAWAQAGGPIDVDPSTPITPTPSASTVTVRHDLSMQMPEAYVGEATNPNDYRCFVLDPKLAEPTFVTGYEVTPDQRAQIHHVQIFHIDSTAAADAATKDGVDGRPGWSCYGGPGLVGKDRSAGRLREPTDGGGLIAGWVPGQDPSVFPDESGVLFQPGDRVVFQVHYHYAGTPEADRSTVSLQTEPGTAAITPIKIVNPLGPVEIPCLPGATGLLCDRDASIAHNQEVFGESAAAQGLLLLCRKSVAELTAGFNGIATSSCDTRAPESGRIVTVMGHMHTLGKSFRLTVLPDEPDQQILLDIPIWNFDWQMNYDLVTPVHVDKGDTVRMTCTWDRSVDPTREQKYIVFAEGTEDEMCFSTYALIPDP